MKIKPFFPVFLALVCVIAYVYYSAEQKPQHGTTVTPKQYIELVEQDKEEPRDRPEEVVTDGAERTPGTNGD